MKTVKEASTVLIDYLHGSIYVHNNNQSLCTLPHATVSCLFLHILFSHIPFLCKDCYIPFQCSLHSYRTLCIFLLQAFYIPIQGPLYFPPCSLYYYQCFFLLSKTLCCAISRTSYTYSRSFLSKFIVLLVPFQHSFNSSLMSFIYLPNSFYYQPMIYFILI